MYTSISYVALEQLKYSLDNDPSLEVYTFVHKTLDNFNRFLYNMKTNLIHFNKKFKRSELKFYHESTALGLQNLYKSGYFNTTMDVPIPSGMKVSYLKAVDVILELFKKLDIETTLNKLTQYFNSDILNSPSTVISEINNITRAYLQTELQQIFSSNKTMEVPLGNVISNLTEVKIIDTKILEFGQIYQKVPQICLKLTSIEKEIDKLVTQLENHKTNINKTYIKELHELIMTIAIQFDAYGVLLAESQRLEKNFVLILHKLVTTAAIY